MPLPLPKSKGEVAEPYTLPPGQHALAPPAPLPGQRRTWTIDRRPSHLAHFAAAYDIIANGVGGQVVARRTFTAPDQPWDGRDFGVLASLLSDDLAKLSEDIAANLPK